MIRVEELSVTLSDNPILQGYSFSVGKGDVLAVLGANGVGKTTLLSCITGLRKADAGRVVAGGRIGYVPQLFHSAFAYQVIDIVLMGRGRHIGLFGAPRQQDYRIARQYLAQMSIGQPARFQRTIRSSSEYIMSMCWPAISLVSTTAWYSPGTSS